MDLKEIKKELKENYKYYSESEIYKSNIDFLLNCLNENDLINTIEIKENEIVVKTLFNSNWFHLYIMDNYKSNFFVGVIFNEIVIYKNYYTININEMLFDMKNYLLSSYYERY